MQLEPKKIVMGVAGAFVALSIWHNPGEAGDNTGNFVGDATDWVQDAFDKVNDFAKSAME